MKYQYRPLENDQDEIRLVTLLPGEFNDPIRLSIQHVPFNRFDDDSGKKGDRKRVQAIPPYPWSAEETFDGDILYLNKITNETSWTYPRISETLPNVEEAELHPHYEALSYTWGSKDEPEIAYAIDSEHGENEECTTIAIYQNLASAFRHLRNINHIRIFWVDAVCINQEDILERNKQIKRMAKIYGLAYRVVAWLGGEECESEQGLATLQYIGDQLEATKRGRLVRAPGAQVPEMWMNSYCFSFDDQTWQPLLGILERSWFYRLWCWQEIYLSSRPTILQCGYDQIRWAVLWKAVLCLHNKERLPSVMFRERCRHIAYLASDATKQPMSIMLDLSRSKSCADSRDKIYGLMGLTAPRLTASITTDYSLPVEHVYKNIFLAHIAITHRLELLKHCSLATRRTGGPSWVPDWSGTDFTAPILSEQLSSGLSCAECNYIAPSILEVKGVRCTAVRTVSATASTEINAALLAVSKWLNDLLETDIYVNGVTMVEAFALTLTMNRTCERHPENHFLTVSESVDLLREIISSDVGMRSDPLYSDREVANIIQKIRGRAFFTTQDGHIGTALGGIQPGELMGYLRAELMNLNCAAGDLVCIFLGCYSPMILRPDGPENFQVVSEAYVHGLGDAIMILGPLPSHWKVIITGDPLGRPLHRYLNLITNEQTAEDPRLGALAPEWERVPYKRLPDDPALFELFKNRVTGQTINSDPRLYSDALRVGGLKLHTFNLV